MPVILAIIRDHHLPITLRTSAISLASRCVDVAPLAMGVYTTELSGSMLDILELEHVAVVEPRSRFRNPPPPDLGEHQQRARGQGGVIAAEYAQSGEQQSATAVRNATNGRLEEEKQAEPGTESGRQGDLNRSSQGEVDGDAAVFPPTKSSVLPPYQPDDLATDANPTGTDPKVSPLRRSAVHLLTSIIRQQVSSSSSSSSSNNYLVLGSRPRDFPARRAGTILRYLASVDADSVVNEMAGEAVGLMAQVGRARLGL
jgi:hypothetical protein